MVTADDFESGFESWVGPIYYKTSITAQGLPEPSSLLDSTSVPEQLNIKAVTGKGHVSCKLIDGCSLALSSATVSVVSAGICHRNKVNSIAWHYQRAQPKIVSSTSNITGCLLDTICCCCIAPHIGYCQGCCNVLCCYQTAKVRTLCVYLSWVITISK